MKENKRKEKKGGGVIECASLNIPSVILTS